MNESVMHTQSFETPVALFIFNRPKFARQMLESIRAVRPKQFFIIADGPRTKDERDLCDETREVVADIDWDCQVYRNYSEVNMGCDLRTETGTAWVFEHVDRAILFEDDDLPNIDFFMFCQELLERYKDDTRVMQIAGTNYQQNNPDFKISESYYFSVLPIIRGFATWKRAWNMYDTSLRAWPNVQKHALLESVFPDPAVRDHWTHKFNSYHSGGLKSWDGKWVFACAINRGLSVVPRVNLVTNIGYGPGATHTTMLSHESANVPLEALPRPYLHPEVLLPNTDVDAYTFRAISGINNTPKRRMHSYLRYRLPWLHAILKRAKKVLH